MPLSFYFISFCSGAVSSSMLLSNYLILGFSWVAHALWVGANASHSGSHPGGPLVASDLRARSGGPSGTLLKPTGGTVYRNNVGDVGNVEVIYKGVSDGSNDFGARTCTIDLHLVPVSENSRAHNPHALDVSAPSTINIAIGMRPHDSGSSQPIWANFVPPTGACGDYHLVVYERQLFGNTVIHFQSAAPIITFKCSQPAPRVFPVGSRVELS